MSEWPMKIWLADADPPRERVVIPADLGRELAGVAKYVAADDFSVENAQLLARHAIARYEREVGK